MMSYEINDKHEIQELTCSGDIKMTLTEIAMLVNGIYCALAKQSEEAAEVFKCGLMMVTTPPASPVWDKHDIDCISIVQRKERGPKQ